MSDEANPTPHPPATPELASPAPDGQWAESQRRWEVIMFTDIEGSVNLQQHMGMDRYATQLKRHDALFLEAMSLSETGRVVKHTGDGFLALFDEPGEAVMVALRFQRLLYRERWPKRREMRVRIGLHEGEVLVMPSSSHVPGTVGSAVNLAARVMGLAAGGQILMTRPVFDHARQTVAAVPAEPPSERAVLSWVAHGAYLVKGMDEPVGIHEIGVRGDASFQRPPDRADAARSVSAEEEATLGWRPGAGLEVPRRPAWRLVKRLGEGGFGEVWMAENRQTRDQRVFKFCFDVVRLRSFKREFALFRVIRDQLGVRQDIASLHEVSLESPPFFLESEYCTGGTLREWLEKHPAPLSQRLEIMAQVARALAAAHSVGVIHKDIKPSNIFVDVRADGTACPRLADFGIGVLLDGSERPDLELPFTAHLTMTGSTARTGTGLYCAPEYMIGKPASIQGDIYSLGVLLYQMVISDFDRPMGAGWRRDVADPLLGDDIAQCVDVDPARRFSSALLVAEQLEAIEARHAAEQAAREEEARQVLHRKELDVQRKRLHLAVVVLSGSLLLLAFMLALFLVVEHGRKEAVVHGREMEQVSRQMEAQKDAAQDKSYVASMGSVREDTLKNRASATRSTLDSLRPAPGERDRRRWEWYYADTVLNPGRAEALVSDRPVRAMAVSPDERTVAVAGEDGTISLWSVDSLERLEGWESLGGKVNGLSWSSQGLLAAALNDGDVAVWDIAKKHETARWKAHTKPVTSVIWHVRDQLLITGGSDGAISLWPATGGEPTYTSQSKGPVLSMALRFENGDLAAILGNPMRILVGKPEEMEKADSRPLNSPGSAIAWQPKGGNIVLAKDGSPGKLWNPYTDARTLGLKFSETPGASAFAWSPQANAVAVGNIDGSIFLVGPWDTTDTNVFLHGHQGRINALQWLSRRDRLLSVSDDGTLRGWDEPRRPAEVSTLRLPCVITAAQWDPKHDRLAILIANDEVRVLDGTAQSLLWSQALPRPANLDMPLGKGALAWSPDGLLLAVGGAGRALSLWRAADGIRAGHIGTVMAEKVSWMPDGQRLLIKDPEGWMTLSREGDSVKLGAPPDTEWLVAFKDGRFASLQADGQQVHLRTIGPAGPALDVSLPRMNGPISCLAVNDALTAVAIGGENGKVAWFDSLTGKWSWPDMSHAGLVAAICWNSDGSRIASVGTDLTCRIYNTALAAENWLLNYSMNPDIAAVGWDAQGDKLMIASAAEGLVRVYDAARSRDREKGRKAVAVDHWLANACAALARNPGEGTVWRHFFELVNKSEKDKDTPGRDLLLAAAELGDKGLFQLPEKRDIGSSPVLEKWDGQALPAALQILQCCVLEQWETVVARCSVEGGSPAEVAWVRLARAEALSHLGRKAEAEEWWLKAWQAKRHDWISEAELAQPPAANDITGTHPSLAPWANIGLHDDWTGGEKNNLASLPSTLAQPGFAFATGPFVQLAGRVLRATHQHMFPRLTDWIPLGRKAQRVAFLVAVSCYSPRFAPVEPTTVDTCVGSLHLLRANGGAVRIPLVYGRNVWDWWVPANEPLPAPPPERVAWTGENPKAKSMRHTIALYRVEWEAGPDEAPVTDISIDSTMHKPAPMLMAVEVVR